MEGNLFAPLGAGGDQVYAPVTSAPAASLPQPQQSAGIGAVTPPNHAQAQARVEDEDEEL